MSRRLLPVALGLLTLAVFREVAGFGFVDADDQLYLTGNEQVLAGLSWDNLRWAFTTTSIGNYHPLTWLSLMLDVEIWGDWPGGFHLTNLALHVANLLLLFAALRELTGDVWKSAFVAALFAIHPLHVESVAWISERKGLLCTLFGLAALFAYGRYANRRQQVWLWAGIALFGLSLLSKVAMVTLPFLLLVLDFWPLGRFASGDPRDRPLRLVMEKLPFFFLAAVFSVVAILSQAASAAVVDLGRYPLSARVVNALCGYALYLYRSVWPTDLAIFYPIPFPEGASLVERGSAFFLLIALSALALAERARRPFLLTGWLWFLGTLVPMLGLVQLGGAHVADRYSYIPIVGLFIACAWGIPSILPDRPWSRRALPLAAVVLLAAFATVASVQGGYWRDQASVFRRAIQVTGPNSFAHAGLARALRGQGRFDAAISEFRRALEIHPENVEARSSLALVLRDQGQLQASVMQLRRLLESVPRDVEARYRLALTLLDQGRFDEGISEFRALLREPAERNHRRREASEFIGTALLAKGEPDRAVEHWLTVLARWPDSPELHYRVALVYLDDGEREFGLRHLREAVRRKGSFPEAERRLERELGR